MASISTGRPDTAAIRPFFRLRRDSTDILQGDAAGSRLLVTGGGGPTALIEIMTDTLTFLDAPNTTDPTTYRIMCGHNRVSNDNIYINRSADDSDVSNRPRGATTLIVMEVAG
jgi:hypothetical protein